MRDQRNFAPRMKTIAFGNFGGISSKMNFDSFSLKSSVFCGNINLYMISDTRVSFYVVLNDHRRPALTFDLCLLLFFSIFALFSLFMVFFLFLIQTFNLAHRKPNHISTNLLNYKSKKKRVIWAGLTYPLLPFPREEHHTTNY